MSISHPPFINVNDLTKEAYERWDNLSEEDKKSHALITKLRILKTLEVKALRKKEARDRRKLRMHQRKIKNQMVSNS